MFAGVAPNICPKEPFGITYILSVYLTTGLSGTPGLLSQGGAILGGLPLSRPDLHFIYNLIETIPLILAFLQQVQRTAQPSRRLIRIPGVDQSRARS